MQTRRSIRITFAVLALLCFTGCRSGPASLTETETASVRAEVLARLESFEAAERARDVEAVLGHLLGLRRRGAEADTIRGRVLVAVPVGRLPQDPQVEVHDRP